MASLGDLLSWAMCYTHVLAEEGEMKKLNASFASYQALTNYVAELSGHEPTASESCCYDKKQLEQRLTVLDPINYAKTRNFLAGDVSRLSPFISTGIISNKTVYQQAKAKLDDLAQGEKFFQELAWREFWQNVVAHHPDWLWQDIEAYKTGFSAIDYADELPSDIVKAETDCACINQFITMLIETGYLHNHARMYLAAYVVHWRRVKWQAGAKWFLYHLLDANEASNNFSWQWVASTFSNKPYIFNLDNVKKYASADIDTSVANNQTLADSYEALAARLFPRVGGYYE